jgi:5-methylcytosine-specific restriction enzyme subunit McrC
MATNAKRIPCKGRADVFYSMNRSAGMAPPVEVRHDVFTADIIENRLLLAALVSMLRIPHRSHLAKSEISRARRLFGGVQMLHFSSTAVPEIVFTRLNRHYQPAIALATLLLRSGSLDLGAGGARGCAFLIDMNNVFERFVRRALRTALRVDAARFPDRPPKIYLDEAGVVPVRPDLCLVDNRQVLWVGDVKYKRLPASAYLNADLYQLLAYALALDLPEGTLIYSDNEGVFAAEHVVVRNRKCLRVIALDLSVPRMKLLDQIASIAKCIPVTHRM